MKEINENDIMDMFFNVARMGRYIKDSDKRSTAPFMGQFRCMFCLERTGPLSQRALADLLNIRPASLSELLSKLDQKGFISRTPSPKDKRSLLVSLTELGLAEVKHAHERQEKVHFDMLSVLTEEEKLQFYNILQKLDSHNKEGR